MEYAEFGLWATARKSLDLYFPFQRPDGRFAGDEGHQDEELDGNGQAPWIFWQYYQLSNCLLYTSLPRL